MKATVRIQGLAASDLAGLKRTLEDIVRAEAQQVAHVGSQPATLPSSIPRDVTAGSDPFAPSDWSRG